MAKRNPTVGEALTALFVAILFFGGIGALILWPRTTQGEINNVDYWGTTNPTVTIQFDDGRRMRLRGHPNVSLKRGKSYRITYNGIDYIYNVEEID